MTQYLEKTEELQGLYLGVHEDNSVEGREIGKCEGCAADPGIVVDLFPLGDQVASRCGVYNGQVMIIARVCCTELPATDGGKENVG